MDKKINFLHTCRKAAAEAEKLFGINGRINFEGNSYSNIKVMAK